MQDDHQSPHLLYPRGTNNVCRHFHGSPDIWALLKHNEMQNVQDMVTIL